MHLFDPERPEVSPGQKAILTDGSAIPHVLVLPLENGFVHLQVMLKNYDAHGGYSWREHTVHPFGLMTFIRAYAEDPEAALEKYFGWTPQSRLRAMVIDKQEVNAAAQRYVDELL